MKPTLNQRKVDQWEVQRIIAAVESGELDLDTEYQRDTIWSKERKSLLIDSILKDVDIPKIYLAHFPKEKRYECIDGKQRIASILDFSSGALQLESGESFTELRNKDPFLGYKLTVSVIQNPTNDDIVELFRRLNIGVPLNGGEMIHAMRGELRDFIFHTIGKSGPFIGRLGIKAYRFSRETALAQIIINSLPFRGGEFRRARYEDVRAFLKEPNNTKFDVSTRKKVGKIQNTLKELESIFGDRAPRLNRKSVIVSAYLFCEYMLEKGSTKDIKKFPEFYIKLLDEMKVQAELHKNHKVPTKEILLNEFQKNLQQASAEGYSLERRHKFLTKAFVHYIKTGEIIGDK